MDLSALGQQFGLTPQQMEAAVKGLAPAIAAGMHRQSGGGGLDQIVEALQKGVQGGGLGSPGDAGNVVLGQIFGSKDVSRGVARKVSDSSGISAAILQKLLPILAAYLASQMAAKKGGTGGGLGDILGSVLGGGQASQGSGGGLGDILGSVLGGGGAGGGGVLGDILGQVLGGGGHHLTAGNDLLAGVEKALGKG